MFSAWENWLYRTFKGVFEICVLPHQGCYFGWNLSMARLAVPRTSFGQMQTCNSRIAPSISLDYIVVMLGLVAELTSTLW